MVYLVLYVDDIVVTASSDYLHEFSMKDLGSLHHFLRISFQQHCSGLFLSQQQYTIDILQRTTMSDWKPCNTPVNTQDKVSATEGVSITDPNHYRSLIGALQYFTFT